jgi:ubiquitin-protein ligase
LSWGLGGSIIDESRLIETPLGYIHPYKLSGDPVFLIVTISWYVKSTKCNIESPLPLARPVAFYGLARYEGDTVFIGDYPAAVPHVRRLVRRKAPNALIMTFRRGHPNVSIYGRLCPGTLGRPEDSWPDEVKIKHMISLLSLLSMPNFDSTLEGYGCKAFLALEDVLPGPIKRCMARYCVAPKPSIPARPQVPTSLEGLLSEASRLVESARRLIGEGE